MAQMLRTNFNIEPKEEGCTCYETMRKMDKEGPDRILSNLDHWDRVVKESSKTWMKFHGRTWQRLGHELVGKHLIRKTIKWACEEVIKEREEHECLNDSLCGQRVGVDPGVAGSTGNEDGVRQSAQHPQPVRRSYRH